MTYELAKQLKDAGFPQDNCFTYWVKIQFRLWRKNPDRWRLVVPSIKGKNWKAPKTMIANPTLSELIEACGDKLAYLTRRGWHFAVTKNPKLWRATATGGFIIHDIEGEKVPCDMDCCGWTEGDTPEEAVARLWLELNKK